MFSVIKPQITQRNTSLYTRQSSDVKDLYRVWQLPVSDLPQSFSTLPSVSSLWVFWYYTSNSICLFAIGSEWMGNICEIHCANLMGDCAIRCDCPHLPQTHTIRAFKMRNNSNCKLPPDKRVSLSLAVAAWPLSCAADTVLVSAAACSAFASCCISRCWRCPLIEHKMQHETTKSVVVI